MNDEPRIVRELSQADAWRRLGSVPFGRVVFTSRALPAILPVNHVVDHGRVIFRTPEASGVISLTPTRHPVVLAYQADQIDPVAGTGWSVLVTGLGGLVDEPSQAARYRATLRSWLVPETGPMILIRPEIVTGYELTAGTRRA